MSGLDAARGTSIWPLHVGQETVWPAISSGASNGCLQLGQLNLTSLIPVVSFPANSIINPNWKSPKIIGSSPLANNLSSRKYFVN
jgi:hypothetical protein